MLHGSRWLHRQRIPGPGRRFGMVSLRPLADRQAESWPAPCRQQTAGDRLLFSLTAQVRPWGKDQPPSIQIRNLAIRRIMRATESRRSPVTRTDRRRPRPKVSASNQASLSVRFPVGTIAAGRIGLAVLRRMKPFDVKLHYTDPHRLSPDIEKELGLTFHPDATSPDTRDTPEPLCGHSYSRGVPHGRWRNARGCRSPIVQADLSETAFGNSE